MLYLKADTITEVTVGPAVAVGDGFTPVTNLVGSSADEFEIIKHGATTTTTIAGTLAAITGADGYYALDLSATDTNTEGRLVLLINDDSLILPIRLEYMVVNANVYDSLFAAAATDYLQIDAIQVNGAAQTATLDTIKAETVLILADTADMQPRVAAIEVDTGTTLENRLIAIEADTDVIDDGTSGLVKIATDVAAILVDTGTTLDGKIDGVPTTAEFNTRTPTAAQLLYMTRHAATALPVTFTTAGGGVSTAVLANVDDVAASAIDDQ